MVEGKTCETVFVCVCVCVNVSVWLRSINQKSYVVFVDVVSVCYRLRPPRFHDVWHVRNRGQTPFRLTPTNMNESAHHFILLTSPRSVLIQASIYFKNLKDLTTFEAVVSCSCLASIFILKHRAHCQTSQRNVLILAPQLGMAN